MMISILLAVESRLRFGFRFDWLLRNRVSSMRIDTLNISPTQADRDNRTEVKCCKLFGGGGSNTYATE